MRCGGCGGELIEMLSGAPVEQLCAALSVISALGTSLKTHAAASAMLIGNASWLFTYI